MSSPTAALDTKRTLTDWWTSEGGHRYGAAWLENVRTRYGDVVETLERTRDERIKLRDELQALVAAGRGQEVLGDEFSEREALLDAERERAVVLSLLLAAEIPSHAQDFAAAPGSWVDTRAQMLREATTYWIADPMAQLVGAAYPSMPSHPLLKTDLPCPAGFALVDGHARLAVPPDDMEGDMRTGFTAVSWFTVSVRVGADLKDWAHGVNLTIWTWTGLPDIDQEFGTDLLPLSMFWRFGDHEPPEVASREAAHFSRWGLAFWNLVKTPAVFTHPGEVQRHAVKRAKRADLDPDVTVITLRTPKRAPGEDHTPGKVDWKNRWMVRGFWRNQWYPSIQDHRPLWIDSYVKGPEDRPLRIRDHVYAWRR